MTLAERRVAANLTQEDVAESLEVDQSTVSKWENGQSKPLAKHRKKLSYLYGCEQADLMESQDER